MPNGPYAGYSSIAMAAVLPSAVLLIAGVARKRSGRAATGIRSDIVNAASAAGIAVLGVYLGDNIVSAQRRAAELQPPPPPAPPPPPPGTAAAGPRRRRSW